MPERESPGFRAAAATKGWKDSGKLLPSVTGAPQHLRNVLGSFHNLRDAAEVPRMRVHDTRRSCGTLLHVQGADPLVIQTVQGHSQLTTTRRYTLRANRGHDDSGDRTGIGFRSGAENAEGEAGVRGGGSKNRRSSNRLRRWCSKAPIRAVATCREGGPTRSAPRRVVRPNRGERCAR